MDMEMHSHYIGDQNSDETLRSSRHTRSPPTSSRSPTPNSTSPRSSQPPLSYNTCIDSNQLRRHSSSISAERVVKYDRSSSRHKSHRPTSSRFSFWHHDQNQIRFFEPKRSNGTSGSFFSQRTPRRDHTRVADAISGWFSRNRKSSLQKKETKVDDHQHFSAFSIDQFKMKGKVLQQKFARLGHRRKHYESEGTGSEDFSTPSISHIYQSLQDHKPANGPGEVNVPMPQSTEALFELAQQRGIKEDTLDRWMSDGVRCWVAFYVKLFDDSGQMSPAQSTAADSASPSSNRSQRSMREKTVVFQKDSLNPASHRAVNDNNQQPFNRKSNRHTSVTFRLPGASDDSPRVTPISSPASSSHQDTTTESSSGSVRYREQALHSHAFRFGSPRRRRRKNPRNPSPSNSPHPDMNSTCSLDDSMITSLDINSLFDMEDDHHLFNRSASQVALLYAVDQSSESSTDRFSQLSDRSIINSQDQIRKNKRVLDTIPSSRVQSSSSSDTPLYSLRMSDHPSRGESLHSDGFDSASLSPNHSESVPDQIQQQSSRTSHPTRSDSPSVQRATPNDLSNSPSYTTMSSDPQIDHSPSGVSQLSGSSPENRQVSPGSITSDNTTSQSVSHRSRSPGQKEVMFVSTSDSNDEMPDGKRAVPRLPLSSMANRSTGQESPKSHRKTLLQDSGCDFSPEATANSHTRTTESRRCSKNASTENDWKNIEGSEDRKHTIISSMSTRATSSGDKSCLNKNGSKKENPCLKVYETSKQIRGGARRWDEWGQCWVGRRYWFSLHCTAGTLLLSLNPPGQKQQRTRAGDSTPGSNAVDDKSSPIKALRLQALEYVQLVANLKDFANRCDVIGGLACIGMAVDIANQREGSKKRAVADKNKSAERKKWGLWRLTSGCFGKRTTGMTPTVKNRQNMLTVNTTSLEDNKLTTPTNARKDKRSASVPPKSVDQLASFTEKQTAKKSRTSNYNDIMLTTTEVAQTEDVEVKKSLQVAQDHLPIEEQTGEEKLKKDRGAFLHRTRSQRYTYRNISILKFRGQSGPIPGSITGSSTGHCLVTVFDCAKDCEEFVELINLLKDFRNDEVH